MPDRSKKRPRTPNQLAHQVFLESIRESPKFERGQPEMKPVDLSKKTHAVALGCLCGLKGGAARAAKLAPGKRSQIAAKAGKVRWSKKQQS